jgi:prepilin-type N-terminal cleavage/methylation domain-containing protein
MKMRKELNNKGFSLVELMIATVILAIIVAPLLHSFVTAAHTTVKSRQMGDATLASENIAEAVEVAPLKE